MIIGLEQIESIELRNDINNKLRDELINIILNKMIYLNNRMKYLILLSLLCSCSSGYIRTPSPHSHSYMTIVKTELSGSVFGQYLYTFRDEGREEYKIATDEKFNLGDTIVIQKYSKIQ
jgi:hypothetical protein